ncbi:cyclase family protein [Blastococcus deserti]|uniref:Cyclase family protein n=1 Tax=Blastococcus deserti TaxID=2259033 RepID=A0ABW4X787_9ACTN
MTVPLVPGLAPLYPGDTEMEVRRVQHRAHGDPANVSSLTCWLHCGTHVDAPVHFLDGQPGVDAVPIETLLGPAWVVDAAAEHGDIDAAALSRRDIPDGAVRVLLRTSNSALWKAPTFVEESSRSLRTPPPRSPGGIRLVGIDYLSSASSRDRAPTHETFLRAGVTILETLDLRAVDPGWWDPTCLPLRIPGAEAPLRGPCSAVRDPVPRGPAATSGDSVRSPCAAPGWCPRRSA